MKLRRNIGLKVAMLAGVVTSMWGEVTGPGTGAEVEWTLRAAVEEARRNSPEAHIARQRIEGAQGMLDQTDAAWWPRLQVEAGYMQTNQPMLAFGTILNTGTFSNSIDFNRPGTVDHFYGQALVVYPLYQGGGATARRAAARAAEEAARRGSDAVLERLSFAVVQGYYRILQMRESESAWTAAVADLEESLRVAQVRFERGQTLKNELLNMEVQVAQTRERLLAIGHQRAMAEKAFQVLLGRPPVGGLRLSGGAAGVDFPLPEGGFGIEQRPELAAMQARVEAAEAMVRSARAGRRPQVEAFAGYQYDRGWRLEGEGDHWMAGMKVRWNVFDGYQVAGEVRQMAAELGATRAELEALNLNLTLQFEQAKLAHELAVRQVEVTAKLVDQAVESASISRARFESGDLMSTELIGVETRLVEARMRRAVAVTNERIAAAEWRWAAGLPLMDGDGGRGLNH